MSDAPLQERLRGAVVNCYQCGKCAAGCPAADQMDIMPSQVFRLLQLGRVDVALRCGAIWQCVSCFTCATRCPQSVECVEVIDALRQAAVKNGTVPAGQRRIVQFQQTFLNNIRHYGRVNELQLIKQFKIAGWFTDWSFRELFAGALLGPELMRRKKLHLKGERVRDAAVVDRIFQRCEALAGASAEEGLAP